jgi:peptidoglycan/LPS O-acetylase OafA/YrhL
MYAILPVLLFHLDVQAFGGGFVGVDVFFVISGYLITKKIRDEVLAGTFSYSGFYVGRARRLFPALYVTFLASLVLSVFFFPPYLLAEFAGSLIYAALSLSNLYFWASVDYFDTAASLKPLLHTWSLSVEEQFYLIWPVLLVTLLAWRRHVAFIAIAAASLGSLWLNLVFAGGGAFADVPMLAKMFADGPSTIYYLLPFRVFELGIGAMTVWMSHYRLRNARWLDIMAAAGLVLILAPSLLYTPKILFPSYNALPPCLGAAMLLYAGEARYVGALLRNALAVWIGRISYSLYLVHWPVIVFTKFVVGNELDHGSQIAIAMLCIALASLMYRFVEQPFRHARKRAGASITAPAFGLACSGLTILLLFVSANAWASGWPSRFPETIVKQLDQSAVTKNGAYVWRRHKAQVADFPDHKRPNILIIGDSQAGDLVNVLAAAIPKSASFRSLVFNEKCQPAFPRTSPTYDGIPEENARLCRKAFDENRTSPALSKADVVMLSAFWRDWAIDALPETVEFLKTKGVTRVIVVGDKQQRFHGAQLLTRNAFRADLSQLRSPPNSRALEINAKLRAAAKKAGAEYFDFLDLFCDPQGCKVADADSNMLVYDTIHLTKAGAAEIGKAAREKWAASLLSTARRPIQLTQSNPRSAVAKP